jgi:hypothetical protein
MICLGYKDVPPGAWILTLRGDAGYKRVVIDISFPLFLQLHDGAA